MNLFLFIVVAVLAIMGAFALLEWWTERAAPIEADVARPRRSILRLSLAFVGGVLIGSYSWRRNRLSRQVLDHLFELELLLAQLDGLVSAALAQGDMTRLLPLIKELVSKIGDYDSRTKPALTDLEDRLSPHDYYDLRLGASMIAGGLNHLEDPTPEDLKAGINDALLTMQKGIRLGRTKTRELIDARISDF